ncbi:putative bifunctional diguanylate cyclase/phosphodiesterase [Thiomicrorhabdus sediminis]|uniref:EAL domain-containing protein n=1 Tax=Thiomicrorhabdus sediminis TaxID=2580412 RepID=A0A4V1HHX4_9GAMM|nr:EAL domain-containing protein [Thiomicrorhabdus sediminis]QCU90533.1 EAL domain-containing protein [Thiomicrorhabdus sediminis]
MIRWNHPTYGLIPPDEFIGFAEMSNTITPLTLWVLNSAIETHAQLTAYVPDSVMSINVSSRNLYDRGFPEQVAQLIKDKKANPKHFILEITESAIMEEPQQAAQTIQALSEMGFDISIDDFGTGYSSLAYLKNLAVNELKIDRTFVSDMTSDDNDYKIVKSTIDLAHNLGLSVTAEGVETEEIEQILLQLNCDITQGYYYSKPLPFAELIDWIKAQSPNK